MKMPHTSHEAFGHDSIDSLGYDWSRVADPAAPRQLPWKLYLPRSTEDVVRAVQEVRTLGQTARIRSKGHSSNDLVLGEVVICTEMMNDSIYNAMRDTVRMQGGAVLADVDTKLAGLGRGLPVIGDHNHITAGGFASVGGISPASHRHGLFVDNILWLEYVTWDGEIRQCDRSVNADEFYRLLTGTGRHGVITWLEGRVETIDKSKPVLRNQRQLFTTVDRFIDASQGLIGDPGACRYERGVWVDYPLGTLSIRVGQFSAYFNTEQSRLAKLRKRIAYGYLHFLGRIAGRLPSGIDRIVKYFGLAGVILSPRYGSVKDIESFTDKVLDSSVGDPTRMLIILAPIDAYAALFREMLQACQRARKAKAVTFISFYVKAIESPYLSAQGKYPSKYAELMLYLGVSPQHMTHTVLEALVADLDQSCLRHDALRYMHTKTSKDEQILGRIDPNRRYAQA